MSASAAPAERLARTGNYRWVRVWGLPLRVMHWTAALSIVTLIVTGLYIGKPYFANSGEASSHFLMGWMRFLHFFAASFLVMTALVRIYWLIAGNRYERWSALVPYKPRDLKNMVRQARSYILVRPGESPRYLGHNPFQQMGYTSMYAIALVQVITGFALYGQYSSASLFYRAFNWIGPLLGGMPNVRFLHHVITWAFVIYVPIHVYLAIRADVLEHNSTISSIITGGRVVPPDAVFVDDD